MNWKQGKTGTRSVEDPTDAVICRRVITVPHLRTDMFIIYYMSVGTMSNTASYRTIIIIIWKIRILQYDVVRY